MYLDFTRKTNNALRLAGLSAEASDPQKTSAEARNPTLLSDVFISLRINRFHDDDESKQKMPREMESLGRERKQLTAIEALSEPEDESLGDVGVSRVRVKLLLRVMSRIVSPNHSSCPSD